jgi:hypothetical protein
MMNIGFEFIRPVLSGLIGGVITIWLLKKLASSVPETCGLKTADELTRENKPKILACNILFFATIAIGVALYRFGYFDRNDWRGLLLIFGLATVAPMLFLVLSAIGGGSQRVKEAFVAYAIAQRVPPAVLYGCLTLGAVCLFVVLGAMVSSW